MLKYKLLPIPLLLLSVAATSHAEHFSLPTLSVEGIATEEIPYALPPVPTMTGDVGDMVKRLPGANINRNGTLSSIAQYRGLFGSRVNVLIDGSNQQEAGPNSMDAPLSYLAASRTKQVSVHRGIAPVSTGIETIGGTISAESKHIDFGHSEDLEVHGEANAGYASNGHSRQLGLTTALTNQHHRLQISGTSDRGDDLDFKGGTIRPSKHDRDTVGLHYGFQNSGTTLNTDIQHLDIGNTGTAALPMDIQWVRGETYKLKFGHEMSNGDSYTVRLRYQDIEHEMDNFSLRTNSNMMRHRLSATDVESNGFSAHYQHQNWLIGADLDQAEHNATIFNPNMAAFFIENFNEAERDRYSVFAEWSGEIATDWNLESGLRYSLVEMDSGDVAVFSGAPGPLQTLAANFSSEDRSEDEHLVDLFATLTHNVSDQTSVEVGLARKTRAPSYQERYLWAPLQSTAGLADGRRYVGDINLDHEVAYQLELGLDWRSNSFAVSPRVFYHHINDYIQGVAGAASAQQQMVANTMSAMMGMPSSTLLKFSNVDAKLYGIDTNWLASISPEWQLDGTVSYVRGKRRDTSDDLYRIAPLTARTMLSYVQPEWRLGFEAETVAKQNKVSSENSEQKTGGYALYHLSGQYQLREDMLISAGVNNLFNRDYTNHLGGYNRAAGNEADIAVGDRLPGAGRSAYINVNLTF